MTSISLLGSTTAKVIVAGLAAISISACAYDDHGRYRGGGYYYADNQKRYEDRDRYDDKRGDRSKHKYRSNQAYDDRDDGYDRGDKKYRSRDSNRAYDDRDDDYDRRGRDYRSRDSNRAYDDRDRGYSDRRSTRSRDLNAPYDARSDGDRRYHRRRGGEEEKYDGYYGRGGYDGGYRVCDSDGDRCYMSSRPYWDYRQYYRNHGYRWDDE